MCPLDPGEVVYVPVLANDHEANGHHPPSPALGEGRAGLGSRTGFDVARAARGLRVGPRRLVEGAATWAEVPEREPRERQVVTGLGASRRGRGLTKMAHPQALGKAGVVN